jgi:hypothetical protein
VGGLTSAATRVHDGAHRSNERGWKTFRKADGFSPTLTQRPKELKPKYVYAAILIMGDAPTPIETVSRPHVLIDYENVQKLIKSNDFQFIGQKSLNVSIFHGPNQNRIEIDLSEAIHRVAEVKFIKVQKAGNQALDLHLAYYLGRFSQETPEAVFHIIAEDGGYDSLVEHLQGKGFRVQKHKSIKTLVASKTSNETKMKLCKDAARFVSEMTPPPKNLEEVKLGLRKRFGLGKKMMLEIIEFLKEDCTKNGKADHFPFYIQ